MRLVPFYADAANIHWILSEETELAIKHLKLGKDPGSDAIQGELLKLNLQTLVLTTSNENYLTRILMQETSIIVVEFNHYIDFLKIPLSIDL